MVRYARLCFHEGCHQQVGGMARNIVELHRCPWYAFHEDAVGFIHPPSLPDIPTGQSP